MVIENVIVMLTCEGNDFDMELPANVKISQLKPMLKDALTKKGIHQLFQGHELVHRKPAA